jgi:hypothetical protein
MQWSTPVTVTFVGILSTYDDEILHEATNTKKGRIIKGRWFRWAWGFAETGTGGNAVYIVYRDPHRKVVSVWVEEALHPVLYLGCHTIILSMVEPVLSSIFSKRKVVGDVSDVRIKSE